MEIYGAAGTKQLVENILATYQPDIRERIDRPAQFPTPG